MARAATAGLMVLAVAACESDPVVPDEPAGALDLARPDEPAGGGEPAQATAAGTVDPAAAAYLGDGTDALGGAVSAELDDGQVLTVELVVTEVASVVLGASGGGTDVDLAIVGNGVDAGNADSHGLLDVLGLEPADHDPLWAGVLDPGTYEVRVFVPSGGAAAVDLRLLAGAQEVFGSYSGDGIDVPVTPEAAGLAFHGPSDYGAYVTAESADLDTVLHVVAADGTVWRSDDHDADLERATDSAIQTSGQTGDLVLVVTTKDGSAGEGVATLVAHDTPPLI